MERLTGWRDLLLRLAFAVLLVLGHAYVWQPVRRALPPVIAPMLGALPTARAAGWSVEARRSPPSVEVLRADGRQAVSYSIPGGLYFLVPGLFLVVVAPRKPYWAVLLGVLVALGVLDLGLVALGVAWTEAGFVAHAFVHSYVVPPLSLAVPLWLTFGGRLQPRKVEA